MRRPLPLRGRGLICGMKASHRTTREHFCIRTARRRCFLLTCACETMNSGFGMRDSDSDNTSSLSAHASTNGRTVDGPQPRPGEAEAIGCRHSRQDRARNGEDRGARTLHWAGSPCAGTFAVVACAGTSGVPRRIGRTGTMPNCRTCAGMARQRRSGRWPDVAGLSARKRCDGGRSAEPAARPAVSQPASTTNDTRRSFNR